MPVNSRSNSNVARVLFALEFKELAALQKNLKNISNSIEGTADVGKYQNVTVMLKAVFAEAANSLRDSMKSAASSGRVSTRVQKAIFSFYQFDAPKLSKYKRSALVGVRTGAPPRHDPNIFRIWGSGGQKRGMSLARMFETGVRGKIAPRYYIGATAIMQTGNVLRKLVDGYRRAVDQFK